MDCSPAVSCVLVDELRLWKRSVSFGGVSSSAELPFYFSHASVDADTRAKHRGVAEAVSLASFAYRSASNTRRTSSTTSRRPSVQPRSLHAI